MNLCKQPRIAFIAIVIAIASAVSSGHHARAAEAAPAASAGHGIALTAPSNLTK